MKTIITLTIILITLEGYSQNIPSYVPTNGLVGFWSMNGTHLDSSPNQTPTTNYGVTFGGYRDNPNNQVGIFNPDTNCNTGLVVTQLDTSGLGNGFSLSFWVKTDTIRDCLTQNPRILRWPGNVGLQFMLLNPGFTTGFVFEHNSPINGMSAMIGTDMTKWNNIVYTYGQDSLRLYLNDSLVWVTNNQHPFPINVMRPEIHFGLYWYNDPIYPGSFDGQLDDIGIWNRELDITEIGNLYGGLTSTNPLEFQNTIKVYPNPTNDYLQIDCGDISSMNGYSIKIINSLGQSVFDEPVSQSPFNIDMNGWNGNGLYFLHLIDGSGNITDIRKIVLQ